MIQFYNRYNKNYDNYKRYQRTEKGRIARRRAVKNYKQKNPEYFKKIKNNYVTRHRTTNISVSSNYKTWEEFINELSVPVIKLNDEVISHFHNHKAFRLMTMSPEKVAITFLMAYMSPKHHFFYELLYFGSSKKFKDTIQTGKYKRFIESFLRIESDIYSRDDHFGKGYDYVFNHFDVEFLSIKKAVEYYKIIGKREFEEADKFLEENKETYKNVTFLRFYNFLRTGEFRVKNLFEVEDKETEEKYLEILNKFFIKKTKINKYANKIPKKEIKKLIISSIKSKQIKEDIKEEDIDKIVDEYFAKQDEYDLEDILKILKNSYFHKMANIQKRIMSILENLNLETDVVNENIDNLLDKWKSEEFSSIPADYELLFFLNKKLKKYSSRIVDIDKVLRNIQDGYLIVMGSDKNDGRVYDLFTNINKELRNLILQFVKKLLNLSIL